MGKEKDQIQDSEMEEEQDPEMESEDQEGAEDDPPAGEPKKKQATPEELAAELEKTRKALKKANAQAATHRKKADELSAAEKQRQDAELSEVERLKKQLADLTSELDGAKKENQTNRLRRAFEMSAREQKLSFVNPQAADDAFDRANLEEVEVDDDGKVSGMDQVLKDLQKSRPYLFAKEEKEDAPDIDATRKGKGNKGELTKERAAELEQRFRLQR